MNKGDFPKVRTESGELVHTGKQRRWLVLITKISDIKAVFLKVLFDVRNGLVCRYNRLGVLFGLMGSLDSRS